MKESTIRYTLGVYHVVAGMAGVGTTFWTLVSLWQRVPSVARPGFVLLMSAALSLFLVVLYAGMSLLRRRAGALRLAVAIQLLQMPMCIVGVWRWTFFAGLYIAVLVSNAPDPVQVGLGLKSALDWSWSGAPSTLASGGINVAPLGVLWLLRRLARAANAQSVSNIASAAGAPAA